jgi:hypothetical protein
MKWSWNAANNTRPKEAGKYLVMTEDGNYRIGNYIINPFSTMISHWEVEGGKRLIFWAELPEKPKVLKVFISQPMSGKTSEEIRAVRNGAKILLCRLYHDCFLEFIESFNPSALGDDKPIEELGKCISLMQNADVVYFAKGYEESRGCSVEFEVASKYKKTILRWSDIDSAWLEKEGIV